MSKFRRIVESILSKNLKENELGNEREGYDNYLNDVKTNGDALKLVPEEFKDYNMYLEAVKGNCELLEYVPRKLIDYNMCLEAIKEDGDALYWMPEEFKGKIKQELGIKI